MNLACTGEKNQVTRTDTKGQRASQREESESGKRKLISWLAHYRSELASQRNRFNKTSWTYKHFPDIETLGYWRLSRRWRHWPNSCRSLPGLCKTYRPIYCTASMSCSKAVLLKSHEPVIRKHSVIISHSNEDAEPRVLMVGMNLCKMKWERIPLS